MSATPIPAAELAAWSAGVGIDLSCWEFDVLFSMSAAFVAGIHDTKPPNDPKHVRAALVSAKMMAGL